MPVTKEFNELSGWTKYIITVETTLLISGLTFFLSGYQNLVTKDDLLVSAPYVNDAPIIKAHISESSETLKAASRAIDNLNERLTREIHQLDIRISRMEAKNGN